MACRSPDKSEDEVGQRGDGTSLPADLSTGIAIVIIVLQQNCTYIMYHQYLVIHVSYCIFSIR